MGAMSHPGFPPAVGAKRDWGTLRPAERLGVGVIGLHEGRTMLVALRESGLCTAVAACDLSETKRKQAEEAVPGIFNADDYTEMLGREDVDIVAIHTPDHVHAEHIEQAFDAGKHVICTKPLLSNSQAGEGLLRTAEETGYRLQVGQSTRFYEPFLRMRERPPLPVQCAVFPVFPMCLPVRKGKTAGSGREVPGCARDRPYFGRESQ